MKTLEQIRNEIAVKYGMTDWESYLTFMIKTTSPKRMTLVFDEIAELWRKEGRFYTEDEIRGIQESAYREGNLAGHIEGHSSAVFEH